MLADALSALARPESAFFEVDAFFAFDGLPESSARARGRGMSPRITPEASANSV